MNESLGPVNVWKTRYTWITWIGITLNLCLSLPLIFWPKVILSAMRVDCTPVTWAQFFGVLLTILSVFYIPAARHVDRYRWFAWGAVGSRAAGVVFSLYAVLIGGANDAFLLATALDGTIGILQIVALMNIERLEKGLSRTWPSGILGVLLLVGLSSIVGWHKLLRDYPQSMAVSGVGDIMEERFNHGSIGTEQPQGIPYWIWMAMPIAFPEHLPEPGGYSSLGFVWKPGDALPIGFSRKKIGYDRVGITCAVCHTGSVQVADEPRPRSYAGGVGNTLNLLGYQQFLFACAKDGRFNADTLMPIISRQTELSWIDEMLYRWVLIPGTKKALVEQAQRWTWAFEPFRDHWGRGRIEPFNPVKRNVLNVAVGSTLGTSDMQPLWNLVDVPGRAYHWDGLNTDLTEVVLSGALGDGATPQSIPLADLAELETWLRQRKAPAWPFSAPDNKLVDRGRQIFFDEQECAKCHGPRGSLTGQITPVAEVGTDPNRVEMWTSGAAQTYNDYLGSLPWKFKSFRSTNGYLNVPLDGLWARAPYLHNGSVPTLADLLEPSHKRPILFWRGLMEFDRQRVGFVSSGPRAEKAGSRYDTRLRGNGNGGHDYGTDLSSDDKQSLVEYLKTL